MDCLLCSKLNSPNKRHHERPKWCTVQKREEKLVLFSSAKRYAPVWIDHVFSSTQEFYLYFFPSGLLSLPIGRMLLCMCMTYSMHFAIVFSSFKSFVANKKNFIKFYLAGLCACCPTAYMVMLCEYQFSLTKILDHCPSRTCCESWEWEMTEEGKSRFKKLL